ncbi:MAG: hypothetical protein J1F05_07280 [Muribaculaceae bacterium]|nr:hypothetical protein [Muribaculaceae bacterium]
MTPSILRHGYRLAAFVAKRRKNADGLIVHHKRCISLRYNFYGGWRNIKILAYGECRKLRDDAFSAL